MPQIPPSTLRFLQELGQNNTREWFQANKKRWEGVKTNFEETIADLIKRIGQFENLDGVRVQDCNYRIARDIRFSPDKSPYKTWLSASFGEGGRKGGKMDYYLHIQPGDESFIGGGMYEALPVQLAKFRQEIDYNPGEIKGIIYDPVFKEHFGEPYGNSLKTAPKGYAKDHPDIDLLRRTQLFFYRKYTDKEVTSPEFAEKIEHSCRILKPYLDFLNLIFEEPKDEV
ncbi:DUF2461 domain-containing protein [Siphonobacter aquaeclarae]|uniref:TIGR02453 family protein n=1 Tax=Siphonobacter aquaeclarae TaxID=563176 RepID=A0A1G9RXN0_9BACT|nr:DUF2461 domain-containing protein [Siphonobacter aquaeclarae]SDM27986.1 TIGR02453 family protein [Siphonobacter aquaeclarae]